MRTFLVGLLVSAMGFIRTPLAMAVPNERVARDNEQAWQLYRRGDCKNAQHILSNALRIAPQWDPLYFNLGVSAERCGDNALAANSYRKYANFEPGTRAWVTERAALLEQYGREPRRAAQDSASGKSSTWWLWIVIPVGALLLAGAAVAATSPDTGE